MTIVPRPGSEADRAQAMGVVSICFVVWVMVALWAKRRGRTEVSGAAPLWLRRTVLGISIVYSLTIILGILG
jgi:hypothetical protein